MSKSPRAHGPCALCRFDRPLCQSHLLPKATYKSLRARHPGNPNPVIVSQHAVVQTSWQLHAPLLCEECETRFRVGGEDWVLANCWRAAGFPLRERLASVTPLYAKDGGAVWACAEVPDIDMDKLCYFAASVFWRSAVKTWRVTPTATTSIDLGPYEDRLRNFLLAMAPFPDKMALAIRISNLARLIDTAGVPVLESKAGFHEYGFHIPGIEFRLFVGSKIPSECSELCAMKSDHRQLWMLKRADIESIKQLVNIYGRGKALQ